MAKRALHWLVVLGTGAAFTACGGSNGATPTTRMPSTNAVTTVPVTEAATTEPTAAPTTTLPPTLNLAELPGLLAVLAESCGPEPVAIQTEVPNPVVCLLRPDGSQARQVSPPGSDPGTPTFTRDGGHLSFSDPYTDFGWVVDIASGAIRERVRHEPLRSGVSPDGKWRLYIDSEVGGYAFANPDDSAFLDGTFGQLVAPDPQYYDEAAPSWAPDSTRFAYLSFAGSSGSDSLCPEVWVGSIDGTPPVQISHFATTPDGAAACPSGLRWSPVGEQILLRMQGKPVFVAENLYVINSDGTGLTALTHSEPVVDPNGSTYQTVESSYAGDWSPDGKYIAFIMGDGSAYHLYVINAEGGQRTEIAAAPLGITTSLVGLRWSLG